MEGKELYIYMCVIFFIHKRIILFELALIKYEMNLLHQKWSKKILQSQALTWSELYTFYDILLYIIELYTFYNILCAYNIFYIII